jgi:hypothetical protein
MASWVEAVKQYAKENGGKFVIPKKDSDDYKKIKALQQKMEADGVKPVKETESPVKQVKERRKKATAPVVEEAKPEVEPVVKPKRVRKVAPVDEPVKEEPKVVPPKRKNIVREKKPTPVVEAPAVVEGVAKPPRKPTRQIKAEREEKNIEFKEEQKRLAEEKAMEEKSKPATVKAPKKSVKEVRAEKAEKNSQHKEENAKERARKELDATRLLIRNQPIVMSFE